MKVQQLLEIYDDTNFGKMKKLSGEFKDLAKKFDLTLVAGMGWPQIGREGSWYGGGIGSRFKKSDEHSVLSVAARRKGFLKALAKELEALLAAGRPVKIAAGAARKQHQEDAIPGEIFDQLNKHAIVTVPPGNIRSSDTMPTVAWFVGNDPTAKYGELFHVTGNVWLDPQEGKKDHRSAAASILFPAPKDPAQYKQLMKWFLKLKKEAVTDPKTFKTEQTPRYREIVRDFLLWADTQGFLTNRGDVDLTKKFGIESHPRLFYDKTRIMSKDIKVEPFEKIEPFLKKHGAI